MGKYYLMASAAVFALTIQPASARSLQVGTCTAKSNFGTIQSAVDAAAAGDTVVVCPGDYPEEVTITKALTLRGINGKPLPRITIPAGGAVANTTRMNGKSTAAQVLVSPATTADVTIANIIVDGSGNNITSCGLELIGIYYRNAGGTVYNSTAQNQLLPPGYQGCQSGQGIFVENETPGTDAITVKRNTVTNFNKNGITFNRAAAVGEITQNTVVGIGPTDQIAQNGIQVGFGATAKVISNTVKNLVYTPATTGSAGILMYSLDSASYLTPPVVEANVIDNAQYGVVLDAVNGTAGNMVQVTRNRISNSQFAGIGLYSDGISDDYINVWKNAVSITTPFDGIDVCSDNNTIQSNVVVNSATEAAIHLDSQCVQPDSSSSGKSNTVSGNSINTACVGILSGPAAGENTIGTNRFASVTNQTVFGADQYSCGPAHAVRQNAGKTGKKKAVLPAALAPVRR